MGLDGPRWARGFPKDCAFLHAFMATRHVAVASVGQRA